MAKNLTAEEQFYERLRELQKQIPEKFQNYLYQFVDCYRKTLGNDFKATIPTLRLFLDLTEEQFKNPFPFQHYHQKVREPIDYHQFGLDFIRPLIDLPHSKVYGLEIADQIEAQLKQRENAILLANHQIEADPQAISILLEKTHPTIVEKIIYVAGERVLTDPLAIPFSMGCDLLCIYSKRYIDHPPELKAQKLLHNKTTMEKMSALLKEGGKIIYVAPSGGRDRKNSEGVIEIAPFDPSSIEMFFLMARKSATPTHFYPLSLATYSLLPPPEKVQKELGEVRVAKRSPAFMAFAPEFNMENFPGSDQTDRIRRRQQRAAALWEIVNNNYLRILSCTRPFSS